MEALAISHSACVHFVQASPCLASSALYSSGTNSSAACVPEALALPPHLQRPRWCAPCCSFTGESMDPEATMAYAYYAEGASTPTFLFPK